MNIQEEVRRQAAVLEIELTNSDVNRIAGTVRFARVRTADSLVKMVEREMAKLVQKVRQEPVAAETNAGTFQKIDASLSQGTCPRCGKKMQDVLLADYTPARYCGGECRITLWPPAEEKVEN